MIEDGTATVAAVLRSSAWCVAVVLALGACGGATNPAPATPGDAPVDHAANEPRPALQQDVAPEPDSRLIPVEDDDPTWGSASAPVTVVAFSEFECPFCARVQPTIAALQEQYGPTKLRIVHKHNPLEFHRRARPAALAAQAVFVAKGSEGFFGYAADLYASQRDLSDEVLRALAERAGVPTPTFDDLRAGPEVARSVERDVELAAALGVNGTPVFLINGADLVGARPLEDFRALVDRELAAAEVELSTGTPARSVYGKRVAANRRASREAGTTAAEPAPEALPAEEPLHRVPVGTSPVQGPNDALVTIVAFSEFECPFCKRANETLARVRTSYGRDVRVVFKHHPLPFHRNAERAARLAILAHQLRGNAGFWEAHDRLFESAPDLEPEKLVAVGRDLKLPAWRVRRALDTQTPPSALDDDQDLAAGLPVKGTPTFFVNGRVLRGAVPFERFEELVDRELGRARTLMRERGVHAAEIYDVTMAAALAAPAPETKAVAAPTTKNPARGAVNAPVVVQVFSDFECPYCERIRPTLDRLEKEFRGTVRIVWRNLPLSSHPRARPAASAALEAFAQGGAAEFWKMHDLLFARQVEGRELDDDALIELARTLRLDVERFEAALADGRHDAAIDADMAAAKEAGIRGTPGVSVNGYFIAGAKPYGEFRRLVRRALADRRPP